MKLGDFNRSSKAIKIPDELAQTDFDPSTELEAEALKTYGKMRGIIHKAREKADKQGKQLIIFAGEIHNDRECLALGMLAMSAAWNEGVYNFGWEIDSVDTNIGLSNSIRSYRAKEDPRCHNLLYLKYASGDFFGVNHHACDPTHHARGREKSKMLESTDQEMADALRDMPENQSWVGRSANKHIIYFCGIDHMQELGNILGDDKGVQFLALNLANRGEYEGQGIPHRLDSEVKSCQDAYGIARLTQENFEQKQTFLEKFTKPFTRSL